MTPETLIERRFRGITGGLNMSANAIKFALSTKTNQRMEFLGDSLIAKYLSYVLFFAFKDLDEGKMSKIKSYLASRRTQAKLRMTKDLMKMAQAYDHTLSASVNVASNIFEAAVGAAWVHCGAAAAERMIDVAYFDALRDAYENWEAIVEVEDPKSTLQTLVQRKYGQNPDYHSEPMEPHGSGMLCLIFIKQGGAVSLIGEGKGNNTKAAERSAAENAVQYLKSGKTAKQPRWKEAP